MREPSQLPSILLKIADPLNPCVPTMASIYDEEHMVLETALFLDVLFHINFQAALKT
jgi:hypothetical protein